MSGEPTAPRYSVVVPVRDEAGTIGHFLRALRDALPPGHEVLICHDDDRDSTLPSLDALPPEAIPSNLRRVRNEGAPGPKQAIEAGMKAARAPVVVVMMADLSDDLSRVGPMVSLVEGGAAVACASRYAPGGRQIGGPWLKGLMSRTAGHLLRWLTDLPTCDPTNSFKAYSRAFLERTPIESRAGFSLALELTVKAHLAGERVAELPATWQDRRDGQSKFRLLRWLPGYLFWFFWGLQALLLARDSEPAPAASRVGRRLLRGARRPSLVRALAAVGLLALVFLAWLDLPREVAGDALDPSWRQAFGRAFVEDRRFGPEFIFTSGPLGFLATPNFEGDLFLPRYGWAIAWAALATLLSARLLSRLPSPSWRVLFVALLLAAPPDSYAFVLVSAALLVLSTDSPTSRGAVAVAALAGALATIKLAILFYGLAVLLPLSAQAGLRRGPRGLALLGSWALGSFVLVWAMTGQPIGGIPRFLRLSAEISSGYGQAMSLTSPGSEWVAGLVVLGLLALAASRLAVGRLAARAALPIKAVVAFALLLAFRHGFTRQDAEHMAPFFAFAAALAFVLRAFAGPPRQRRRGGSALLLAAFALSSAMMVRLGPPLVHGLETRSRHLAWSAKRAVAPWLLRSELERTRQALADSLRLDRLAAPIGAEDADLLTVQQGVLFLNRLRWRPRPVLQSYSAYTPTLAELDRAFFAGPRAPAWVLVRWSSIDGRLPALEDGPALLELLARYRPVDEEKDFLLMRLAHPVPAVEPPQAGPELWRGTFRLDEPLSLDRFGDGPKALTLRLAPTRWGRLRGALLGAPELAAELTGDDGRSAIVRVVPAMAESPFLIDPLARRDRDLDHLLRGGALPRPVSLRFLPTPRVRAFYRDEVEATLYALPALDPLR